LGGVALVLSVTAHPPKMLEPIDDTIDRIAGVVFAVILVSSVLAAAP
jgi:hypothetical protein